MKRKRRIYFNGEVAYVSLANARGVAKVDTDRVGDVSAYNWTLSRGYAKAHPRGGSVYMHRLLCPTAAQVDHIDGDSLNNCASNLRSTTQSQNMQNARPHADGSAAYKGVSFHKRRGKWRARIYVKGVEQSLGSYYTPEAAARAYNEAARAHFGEYARLNPIPEAV